MPRGLRARGGRIRDRSPAYRTPSPRNPWDPGKTPGGSSGGSAAAIAAVGGAAVESPLHAIAFTSPFNRSGHPAATVRAGFTDAGLPAGLQIVGPRHRDDLVLRASAAYDAVRPMDRWPDL
ncbi:MAG: amidase family protein [Candidatus Binatia bacterium]